MTTERPTLQLTGVLADRDSWTATRCSMDAALQAIGNRTALLIVREAFYGATRFDEFARRVGITDTAAAARLRELVELGVLERRPYREPGQRTRSEYVLTDRGQELLPVALALLRWGDTHLTGQAGAPLELSHTGCGCEVQVEVRCAAGHHVDPQEITVARRRRARPDGNP